MSRYRSIVEMGFIFLNDTCTVRLNLERITRKVEWWKVVNRTSLTQSQKNRIIVLDGVFPNYIDEIAQDGSVWSLHCNSNVSKNKQSTKESPAEVTLVVWSVKGSGCYYRSRSALFFMLLSWLMALLLSIEVFAWLVRSSLLCLEEETENHSII